MDIPIFSGVYFLAYNYMASILSQFYSLIEPGHAYWSELVRIPWLRACNTDYILKYHSFCSWKLNNSLQSIVLAKNLAMTTTFSCVKNVLLGECAVQLLAAFGTHLNHVMG